MYLYDIIKIANTTFEAWGKDEKCNTSLTNLHCKIFFNNYEKSPDICHLKIFENFMRKNELTFKHWYYIVV